MTQEKEKYDDVARILETMDPRRTAEAGNRSASAATSLHHRRGKGATTLISSEAMTDPEKLTLSSANITDEQRTKLKTLFPEVFTEGSKVDFERLKLTLGESVDPGKERYGLNWPGKADCFKTIQMPSMATLVPAREESVNFDTT